MRVLQVMASGARGGGADHLLGLLPELARLGVVCDVAIGEEGPTAARLRELGLRVEPVELLRSRLDPRAVAALVAVLRRLRPQLVHYHGTRAAFYGALARPFSGVRPPPSVYTVHGLSYRKEMGIAGRVLFAGVEALACRAASRVISVSRSDLVDLERRRLLAAHRGLYIPNAVDGERFRAGGRDAARDAAGIPREAFVVMTVSRLVPQKSVADLIAAAASCPGVLLVIVGDGPQRRELEARAADLAAGVRFLGVRDDVPELLRAADLFVLSSRWEGEPIALLEALATGLPCVATDTPGAREVLSGTGAGLLVPVGAVSSLARSIRELAASPETRTRMARAARRAVQWRRHGDVARQVARLYAELV